jgi:uracil-DNA glycosylase
VSLPSGNRLVETIGSQVDAHHGEWAPLLRDWAASAAGQGLSRAVDARLAAGATIYPADVFRALALTPLSQVRVLILGQDPYHGPGQAEGLAFSVPIGQALPLSLSNVVKELQRDLGLPPPRLGSLLAWARQGVLLLNISLTVEDGRPGSHAKP